MQKFWSIFSFVIFVSAVTSPAMSASASHQAEARKICTKGFGAKGFKQAIYRGPGVADCLGAGTTLKKLRVIGAKGCAQRGMALANIDVQGGGNVKFSCKPK